METTQTLVEWALQGDRNAFALLVKRYERLVLGIGFHVLRDFHAAQDIAQESFVTAYFQLSTLRNPAVFGPWVAQMAARFATKRGKESNHSLPLNLDLQTPFTQRGDWDQEDLQQVLAALTQLPDPEREVMILRYIDGHDVATIARLTERPVGTVTKQISRALERLRHRMKQVKP